MKCPICNTRRATSTHHIKPRDSGGSDDHRNKVTICRPCHNIVEEIHDNTGAELSLQVIELIRLEYGFPDGDVNKDIDWSILATSLYRLRRKYRFAGEKRGKASVSGGISIRCPHCNKWHYPDKKGRIICPELVNETEQLRSMRVQAEEAEVFSSLIMENIKKVRASIE